MTAAMLLGEANGHDHEAALLTVEMDPYDDVSEQWGLFGNEDLRALLEIFSSVAKTKRVGVTMPRAHCQTNKGGAPCSALEFLDSVQAYWFA